MLKPALLAALAATLVLTGAVVGATSKGIHGARGRVFVTERELGSVTAFDARTGVVLWTAKTGAAPIGVTAPHGTRKVYTSDEGSNQMSVFDKQTGAFLHAIPMGSMPHHLIASPNGKLVYVGEFGQNTIGVVDTASDIEVAHYVANADTPADPLLAPRTHAVFVTANGKELYATNTRVTRTETGDVAHLDARTGELLCNTAVGKDPSEILVTRDGKVGYVSVRGEDKVKELDLTGDCPVLTGREAVVGTQPDTLQLTNDRKTLVVTLRGTPAQISLLDTETFAVRLVNIPGHRTTGHHWLSANGKYTFVAVEVGVETPVPTPAGVAVVNNATGETVADYAYPDPPGGMRPHGVFYEPATSRGRG
jgi:DNA-binding beta-propeller fold protein YncE